jgi:hypothetical protein
MWGALSDERMGLSFTIDIGPLQRSHSRVRVPRDSWPYFSVSDLRLTQPEEPGSRIYIPQQQGGPVIPSGTGLIASAPRYMYSVGRNRKENASSNDSSIAALRICRTVRIENTASQLLHWCVLRICCIHYVAKAVVYRVITFQRVYMLQYYHILGLYVEVSNLIRHFFFGLWGYWHCCHSWPIVPASGDSEDDCAEADGM